jgi:DNA recombination protein RmuC
MDIVSLALGIIIGGALGVLLISIRSRSRQEALRLENAKLQSDLDREEGRSQEKLAVMEQASRDLKDSFKALSADALKNNNRSFIELATETLGKQHQEAKGLLEKQQQEARGILEKQQVSASGDLEKREQAIGNLVKPISESLDKVSKQVTEIEKNRAEIFGDLNARLRGLAESQDRLQGETANLVQALRKPSVRGQWGEMQLKRVVEMAGMLDHCDFQEQLSVSTEEGQLRPDMVISLPGGKNVVVDAKTPLEAYLEALDADEGEKRQAQLARHARHIKKHIGDLSRKAYWDLFDPSPEFVIMFLPSESIFYAALEQDPSLIEEGVAQKVILATPTTLIALLRTIAYGWQQETLADNARQISQLGNLLYDRLRILGEHFSKLGGSLDKSVKIYNETVGSLERNVLSTARKFNKLGVSGKSEIGNIEPIDKTARELQSPEMKPSEE